MAEISIPSQKKPRKKRKGWLVLGTIAGTLGTLGLIFTFLPAPKQTIKPFFENGGLPLVIAHQGGEHLAPSNTMIAFEQAVNMGVDVLETDIHITKDGQLIAIHDPTVDRTTDGTGLVADLTLEEIQRLDAGYHFIDLEGNKSFRGKGVTIPTVEEMFRAFPDTRIEIEIKDTNPPEKIEEIARKLWELAVQYNREDSLLVASFDQEILNTFNSFTEGRVALVGGRQEITRFVLFHKLFVRNLYKPEVDAFQVPLQESIFDLTNQRLINDAKRSGVQMQYWTIDDKETMRYLLERGADGILTNRPDLLLEVMEEMAF
ncbi:glycerophosphodiester phosphodiesterase [Sutcliffiella horikoshii]|uniref:glycerophosphodiester phosphodiesterase n=1 Tax=Sutcliffiella horikoshii TaxID=79883 RepID=UPI0007D08A33|nr:glycerophosphodiester phosphodiesterase [Sutcliffiella horikoshii]MCM3618607.1 glycerophosphodiester phosphodiesterase [Sutcliffiella horikoshii]